MSDNHEETAKPIKLRRVALWAVIGMATLTFCVLKFSMSRALTAVKNDLTTIKSDLKHRQELHENAADLFRTTIECSQTLQNQSAAMKGEFRAFDRPSMAEALLQRLELPANLGVLCLTRVSHNGGQSNLLYVPDQNQSLVVLLKLEKKDTSGSGEVLASPDKRFEIPIQGLQLVPLDWALRTNESGSEFHLALGENEPIIVSYDELTESGHTTYGVPTNPIDTNLPNLNYWPFRDAEQRARCFSDGFWHVFRRRSVTMEDNSGNEQRLQILIGCKSLMPLFVSPQQVDMLHDQFELELNSERRCYQIMDRLRDKTP